jgi:hypothetical protein
MSCCREGRPAREGLLRSRGGAMQAGSRCKRALPDADVHPSTVLPAELVYVDLVTPGAELLG